MFHIINAYYYPNVIVKGYMCKTNIHSHTAFRGFGGPQGMFAGENLIRDIAEYLGKDVTEVSHLNLMEDGKRTHYSQLVENCSLRKCWEECMSRSQYEIRTENIKEYNR